MIVGVAIKYDALGVVSLLKPNRHDDIIRLVDNTYGMPTKFCDSVQGFIDDKGLFLDRIQAGEHALECGQIEKRKWGKRLFSEDLW